MTFFDEFFIRFHCFYDIHQLGGCLNWFFFSFFHNSFCDLIREFFFTIFSKNSSEFFYRIGVAQHPELETYLQGKHANLLNCADCHMAIEMADDGTVYHSHYLVSPLESKTILSTCVQCHGDTDMVSMVRRIQDRITDRETELGNKLSNLKDALAAAVSAGKKTEAELDQVRKLYREAQWFFDFCYVENSEGAHNSDLSTHCLDVSEQRINEAMALLN